MELNYTCFLLCSQSYTSLNKPTSQFLRSPNMYIHVYIVGIMASILLVPGGSCIMSGIFNTNTLQKQTNKQTI